MMRIRELCSKNRIDLNKINLLKEKLNDINLSKRYAPLEKMVINSKPVTYMSSKLNLLEKCVEPHTHRLSNIKSLNVTNIKNKTTEMLKHTTLKCRILAAVHITSVENVKEAVQESTEKVSNQLKATTFASLSLAMAHTTSVENVKETTPIVEPIPEPPAVPESTEEVLNQLNQLGEPTFSSLGLGGWSPVGIIQNSLEYLHVTLGVPWWEAIVIGTIVIRILLFPLVIIAQRNAARMNNYMPQLQVLQLKMTEARQSGNQLDVARYSQELMLFMKEKQVNPLKNMIVPLAQMPVFISFFVGLRQMANVPVDSLRHGGMMWFTDLTVPDQFFAMPIITSLTLWATIELGTDSAKLSAQNMQVMKYVLRALPLVILPFTINFPGVILCYWVSSNFISLLQVGFLKIPAIRDYFNIEPTVKHNPENLPIKSKGFVGGVKDSWQNMKITKQLEERRNLDEMQFRRAGKGPIAKTYKYDPTKQTLNAKKV